VIRLLSKLLLALTLFLSPLLALLGWEHWQTRELRAFCAAVLPGMSFGELAQLAAAHHIEADAPKCLQPSHLGPLCRPTSSPHQGGKVPLGPKQPFPRSHPIG
jgi:hypothetical protein